MANDEKMMRTAHKILTEIIWKDPALSFSDGVDIPCVLLKSLIVSNAESPEDMRGMVAFAHERMTHWLGTIDIGSQAATRVAAGKGKRR